MRAASKTGLRKSPGGAGGKAQTEIEVKLRVADRRRLLRQLARLRAELTGARVHEMNTLYDTAEGNLARQGRMLRVRVERPASGSKPSGKIRQGQARGVSDFSAVLTFKGPVGPPRPEAKRAAEEIRKKERAPAYKIREEHEIRVSDQEEVSRIIEGLGFRPCFRYEKFRTTYRLPGIRDLKLEVDETPIGLFLELEGPGRAIDRAAARLGFGRAEYINKSYAALFMEERGVGRRFKSRKSAGAEAGKASHDEPTRFSGLPDMLFSSSR
jgi:adenylate cyclase class 2